MNNLKTFLQGAVMGLAEIIPGVSGSTLALIMGIYDRFIDLLHGFSDIAKIKVKFFLRKSSFKEVMAEVKKVDWQFGIVLVLGMLISIGVLSNVFSVLLEEYPQYAAAIFFGLIAASSIIPWQRITKVDVKIIAVALITAIVVFVGLSFEPLQPSDNPNLIFLFFGGMVAISGMVLPGVSGSFILLLLGLYEFIIDSIKQLTRLNLSWDRFLALTVFILGLLVGFILFVRVIKWALKKANNEVMAIMTGLMIGSLRSLWPFFKVIDAENHLQETVKFSDITTQFSVTEISIILGLGVLAAGVILGLQFYRQQED